MSKFLHNYVTYSNGETMDNGWWKIDGKYLYNRCGGRQYYEPSIDKGEIVEAEDFDDLYKKLFKLGKLFNNIDEKCGWLSREGVYYKCDYEGHDRYAELTFDKSERQLEEEGWVKITRLDMFDGEIVFLYTIEPTEQQIKYIVDNYYDCKNAKEFIECWE